MKKEIILTTMCMIYNGECFLVQNRIKNDWPGINFPGGKVKDNESIYDSCIREIKEETNLDISNLECMGYYEWNDLGDDKLHLCILFRTNTYSGEIKSSAEGEVFFIKEEDLPKYKLSNDFSEILKITKK